MSGPKKMAYTAAGIGLFVFALGWIVAGFLPEPQFAGTDDGEDEESIPKEESTLIEESEEEETTAPDDENVNDDSGGEKG